MAQKMENKNHFARLPMLSLAVNFLKWFRDMIKNKAPELTTYDYGIKGRWEWIFLDGLPTMAFIPENPYKIFGDFGDFKHKAVRDKYECRVTFSPPKREVESA